MIIIKPLIIAFLLMKIAFFGGNAFWKMVEVALLKRVVCVCVWGGGGRGGCLGDMTACDFPGY